MAANTQQLRQLIDTAGLGHMADALVRLAKPAVGLRTHRTADETLPVGSSKVGGLPDLPEGTAWPEAEGRPGHFLAQFNLREVYPHDRENLLPTSGLLAFFLGLTRQEFYARIMYFEEATLPLLRRTQPPAPAAKPERLSGLRAALARLAHPMTWLSSPSDPVFTFYDACAVELRPALSLPGVNSVFMEPLQLTQAEAERYRFLLSELQGADAHQLLGYPEQMQGDVQLEAADGDSGPGELRERAAHWPLLAQFDADDQSGMDWGDGPICLCIGLADLQGHEFSKVRAVYQFT